MNNNDYLKEIGKRIRNIRKAKKYSLRVLGGMCEMHEGTISEIENGLKNCHILTLKNMADKLEVDVKDFM